MTYAYTATERKRVSFGKIPEAMELPNLISVQRESFERFKDEGLREAFKESSPIQSQNHVLEVTFGEHQFGDPAHTVEECREKDMTYQAPLLTDVRLTNKETGEIKEQLHRPQAQAERHDVPARPWHCRHQRRHHRAAR